MTVKRLQKSRIFATEHEHAYDVVLVAPLTDIFRRRYLAIAPIAEVSGQDGVWGQSVGQRRAIRLSDGATMIETLTAIDAPNRFRYAIGDLTGPLQSLVSRVEGTWAFEPSAAGTTITWSWDVTPKGTVGRMVMPVFGRMWSGYANRAMDQIQLLLVAQ
ncbi:MAG TPA: SRPBCC family protein [Ilumatobacter sp.]|nr:SRPBCC family protein [Ilumatobacter sp.]